MSPFLVLSCPKKFHINWTSFKMLPVLKDTFFLCPNTGLTVLYILNYRWRRPAASGQKLWNLMLSSDVSLSHRNSFFSPNAKDKRFQMILTVWCSQWLKIGKNLYKWLSSFWTKHNVLNKSQKQFLHHTSISWGWQTINFGNSYMTYSGIKDC